MLVYDAKDGIVCYNFCLPLMTTVLVVLSLSIIIFTCRPAGAAQTGTILDIILWKNSTLGWEQIVKIWLKIEKIYLLHLNYLPL
jgi:hypothetical protein